MTGDHRTPALRAVAAAIGAVVVVSACTGGVRPGATTKASTSTLGTSTTTSTTVPPTTSTTVPPTTVAPPTTVDPGALPQTSQVPSTDDPQFTARMSDLLQAIATGDPGVAAAAFFPLSAYVQVKAIYDPEHDYRTRLLADYDQDILALHSHLAAGPAPPVLDAVTLEERAQWIVPGVEYNKGSYWRVYDTRVYYRVGGQLRYFTIASLISWRGEWYVVHLSAIR